PAVLVVPQLFPPNLVTWRGVKPVVFEMLVLALLGLALAQAAVPKSRQRILQWVRFGPNQPILMLVLYGAVSWFRSSSPQLSEAEWLRLAGGAGLYFVIVTAIRERGQIRAVVNLLMAVAILTSVIGLVGYGQLDQVSRAN